MIVVTTKCPETSCAYEAQANCIACHGEGQISLPVGQERCKLTVNGVESFVTDPVAAARIARHYQGLGKTVRLQRVYS